jgi:indoleamine 2,3-dioxygenase
MAPDPVRGLAASGMSQEAVEWLADLATTLPAHVAERTLRDTLEALPVFNVSPLSEVTDFRLVERAFQIYSHLAQTFVWVDEHDPRQHIPAGVAVPFVKLANLVERLPIIIYAMTALANYERLDSDGEIEVDNTRVVQKLIDIPDESWFHLIHVEIERHAAPAIDGCVRAVEMANHSDTGGLTKVLAIIPPAFDNMIATFKRIGIGCKPETYFHTLRPYLFGFDDIVYEGVEEFGGVPQTFRGETGAQSTVIPAIQRFLGLRHAPGGLTEHLEIMIDYMPKPHREFLRRIDKFAVRDLVVKAGDTALTEVYNECLQQVVEFRSLHLKRAHAYIARRVENPIGTGGTDFMRWLEQLRDETNEQLV